MTIYNIAKQQIIYEYGNAGKFDVVTYNDGGKRVGTYAGLDMHKAFAEMLRIMGNGTKVLVLQWPEDMPLSTRWEIEKFYITALPYVAKIELDRTN